MFRFWIILSVCICTVLGRRIEIGKSWNLDNWQEMEPQPLTIDNYDPVLAAEGKELLKIKSDISKLKKEEADVMMDILKREKHQSQREKHQHHPRQHHYLGESDDEDHEYLGEGSGIVRYFAM